MPWSFIKLHSHAYWPLSQHWLASQYKASSRSTSHRHRLEAAGEYQLGFWLNPGHSLRTGLADLTAVWNMEDLSLSFSPLGVAMACQARGSNLYSSWVWPVVMSLSKTLSGFMRKCWFPPLCSVSLPTWNPASTILVPPTELNIFLTMPWSVSDTIQPSSLACSTTCILGASITKHLSDLAAACKLNITTNQHVF